MNAWDSLEAELRAATQRAAGKRRATRRRRFRGSMLVLAAGAALVALAFVFAIREDSQPTIPPDERPVALSSSPPPGGLPPETQQGSALAGQAVQDTRDDPACTRTEPGTRKTLRLVEQPPLPTILKTLPRLRVPVADPDAAAATIPKGTHGDVLRPTVRELRFPGDLHATVYVSTGAPATVADPRGCADARNAFVENAATGALRASALAALAARTDADPDAQTLYIWYGEGRRSRIGVGIPIAKGTSVPTGIHGFGGLRDGRRAYVGLAGPGAVRVRIGALTVPVQDGVFVFARSKGLGRQTLQELDRNGRVLRSHR